MSKPLHEALAELDAAVQDVKRETLRALDSRLGPALRRLAKQTERPATRK